MNGRLKTIATGLVHNAVPMLAISTGLVNMPASAAPTAETAGTHKTQAVFARVTAPVHAEHEIRCLARAIYHEARGEPLEGQIAVAEVVIARSRDRRWKGDLCHTIRMPKQFSFVRNGRSPPIPDPVAAQRMTDLARSVSRGTASSAAKGSLYYHADYVSPSWRNRLVRTATIKTHVFYRDPSVLMPAI